ncbi:hypothetical protein [Runella sp.]|uniref:hypothetical protein n=1 Tax=Runella sp. TaxID=1960881 RepID=UPI003D097CC0
MPAVKINSFSVVPKSLHKANTITLSWEIENAQSIKLSQIRSGGEAVDLQSDMPAIGSVEYSIKETITYRLSADNISRELTVKVGYGPIIKYILLGLLAISVTGVIYIKWPSQENSEPRSNHRQTSQVIENINSPNCPEELYSQLLKEGEELALKGNYTSAESKFWDVQKLLDVHDCLDKNKAILLQKKFIRKAEQFCNTYRNEPTLKYIPNNYYKMAAILQKKKPKQCL